MKINENIVKKIVKNALKEDMGKKNGDVTTQWIVDKNLKVRGEVLFKEEGVLAGMDVFYLVFKALNEEIDIKRFYREGQFISKNSVVAVIEGKAIDILSGERTALNFLQHLCGIATLTRRFVNETEGTKTRILDTRKTLPNLRYLEKYAVTVGGGKNHRMGLYDMVLIKDNHIVAAGSIERAIEIVMKRNKRRKIQLPVEIEVKNINELLIALRYPVQRIMLDNMDIKDIKKAVELVNGKVPLEVSGGVNIDMVKIISQTGIDYISVGALTHSAKAIDISLELSIV